MSSERALAEDKLAAIRLVWRIQRYQPWITGQMPEKGIEEEDLARWLFPTDQDHDRAYAKESTWRWILENAPDDWLSEVVRRLNVHAVRGAALRARGVEGEEEHKRRDGEIEFQADRDDVDSFIRTWEPWLTQERDPGWDRWTDLAAALGIDTAPDDEGEEY